jgi:adenylyltransferase/sulfurtransferase
MAIKIVIPTPFRKYTDGQKSVELEAENVSLALGELVRKFPELERHLFNEQGELRNFINIFIDENDIRDLSGLETPLGTANEVIIVPALAGGNSAAPAIKPDLSLSEISRYSRHITLNEVGLAGQLKLKAARVLMIGTGGLGSPLGLYLAAAGIGTICIVDFDRVEDSNLQRQIIHGTKDVGRYKVESAAERIKDLNPNVRVNTVNEKLSAANALELVKEYDLVIDGTDNFATRYLVNDACVFAGKPNIYGSISGFEGQASVFNHDGGPCYRCIFPEPPPSGLVPSCAEGGVLGVLPGLVGTIQATEAIKLILGAEGTLNERLLLIDAWQMEFRELKIKRNPNCQICGERPTIKTLAEYQTACEVPAVKTEESMEEITAQELKELIESGEDFQLIDVREPNEYEIAKIPNSKLIPLGEVVKRLNELDPEKLAVIHCKGGVRSAKAIAALKQAGYNGRLINLKGGITAWSREVDSSVPIY